MTNENSFTLMTKGSKSGEDSSEKELLRELQRLRENITNARGDLSKLYEQRQRLLTEAYELSLNMSEVARAAGITREAMYRVLRRNGTQFRG